jgi:SPP1 gp7 family putative phage head morphogenesis protein
MIKTLKQQLEEITNRGVTAAATLAQATLKELLKIRKGPGQGLAALRESAQILAKIEPKLANIIQDGLIASWLLGPYLVAESQGGMVKLPLESDVKIEFPIIKEAEKDLDKRKTVLSPNYDLLDRFAKKAAFTVARVTTLSAVEEIQKSIVEDIRTGGTLRDFKNSVTQAIGASSLSPSNLESVYRTNVGQAYASGLVEVLNNTVVGEGFPYLEYHATHDSRTDPNHMAMEGLGISGSNIYRRDDPLWEDFFPPWRWNCRCLVIPLSLRDAARKGIQEAILWLQTGMSPIKPEWVKRPAFSPPPGWSGTKRLRAIV